jgi:hypothetical protein
MTDSGGMTRRQFVYGTGVMLASMAIPQIFAAPTVQFPSSVLILGDSMALCGFGRTLDQLFREAGSNQVNTYMACGTNPLSWLIVKGYQNAKTRCGFHKIEDQKGLEPAAFQDTYGMKRGHRPGTYPVPKLEDLIPRCNPEVVVVQLGNNLFDLLKGPKHERMPSLLTPYLTPFLSKLVGPNSPVRRVYWVTPPICKRISERCQDILVKTIESQNSEWLRVIDSRFLIPYPYRNMQPDQQHFFGPDMTIWANETFKIITKDLEDSKLSPSFEPLPPIDVKPSNEPSSISEFFTSNPRSGKETQPKLVARCRLEKKLTPFTLEEIAPYHESLVGYVYRILEVYHGRQEIKEIVVLRPAHINNVSQPLKEHHAKRVTTLTLLPIEDTNWGTLKTKDPAESDELDRFICEEDHIKLSNAL